MTRPGTAKAAQATARVTKRGAHTRSRLVTAAIEVFAVKGYERTTIKDVCTAAGYTRGAFYSHFDNLEELLWVVYHQWTAQIAEQIRSALEAGDPQNDLPRIVGSIVEKLVRERDWLLIKADLLSVAARNPELAHRWAIHRDKLLIVIEELLASSGVELDTPIGTISDTARAIMALYDGLGTQLLLEREEDARAWATKLLTVLLPVHGTA
ncbi:hypothetical protein A5634_04215 [Mycobacterium asiaticum]|uniref:HTH tetR-type domain-containing protein n=2 Tax=Mycobacterium asiaticum TaxID=1790 RepID=A0A1A3NSN9_MYCAS|nr:hypothetical protein A5634_04215 [Mycobacterium asiaticum]